MRLGRVDKRSASTDGVDGGCAQLIHPTLRRYDANAGRVDAGGA